MSQPVDVEAPSPELRGPSTLVRLLTRERAHDLTVRSTAVSAEPLSAAASTVLHPGGTVRMYKGTYAANAPSEDRATVVIGTDFVFGGVWDGHGGKVKMAK